MAHETIHSGHFMTSNPHTDPANDDEDGDVEVDVVEDDDKPDNNNLTAKDRAVLEEKPVTFYKFGPKKTQSIAIDVSLNKLNKCIKVAYNKMTTPKWKDFKGLRLHWKQRIRLNNVIWRAYYIEFVRNRNKPKPKRTPFCYFAVPDDDTTHMKIEGSLLEGMYWKRRMEAVCAQYKRWRHYMKTRRIHNKIPSQKRKRELEIRSITIGEPNIKIQRSQTPKNNVSNEFYDEDDFENAFTDSLFESLNQPYMFPNPREMLQSGNADIMQPGLLSLQPSLEEIMASLDDPQKDSQPSSNTNTDSPQTPSTSYMTGPPSAHPRLRSPQPSSAQASSLPSPSIPTTPTPKLRMAPPNQQLPQQRQSQDYAMANMLIDYSNQCPSSLQMPTRQSSSITSQMLMLSSQGVQPQYSTAPYDQRSWKPNSFLFEAANVSNQVDYLPQFLQSQAGLVPGTQTMNTTSARSWWMDSPIAQSPLPASSSVGSSPHLGVVNIARMEESMKIVSHQGRLDGSAFALKREEEKPFASATNKEWSRAPSSSYSLTSHQQQPPSVVTDSRNVETHAINQWKLASLESSEAIYPAYVSSLAPASHRNEPALTRSLRTSEDLSFSPGSSKTEPTTFKEEPLTGPPSVKMARVSSRQVPADSTLHPEERKRIQHLHAEQNRRSALKDGFDQLMELIPDLYSGGVKPTNAVVLAKSAEHIRRLMAIKADQQEKKAALEEKINKLNVSISSLQSNLPYSSGVPSSSKVNPLAAIEGFYDRYTKEKSKTDWRFWIMSRMLQPIVIGKPTSLASVLSTNESSSAELAACCSDWLNKFWKGPELRPLASTILVHLATNTNVLSNPESLCDYVKDQVKNPV